MSKRQRSRAIGKLVFIGLAASVLIRGPQATALAASLNRNVGAIALARAVHSGSVYPIPVSDTSSLLSAGQWLGASEALAKSARTQDMLALQSLALGDRRLAASLWRQAGSYPELLARGDTASVGNSYADAREWYSLAAAVQPEFSPAWCRLALISAPGSDSTDLFQLSASLDSGWRNSPERIVCLYQAGLFDYEAGQFDSARSAFLAVASTPDAARYPKQLAGSFTYQGLIASRTGANPERARQLFSKALVIDPDNVDAMIGVAESSYALDADVDALLGAFRRVASVASANKWHLLMMATFLASKQLLTQLDAFCGSVSPAWCQDPDVAQACRCSGHGL
jgi:tetratricopeptide (TPR) repeat protein